MNRFRLGFPERDVTMWSSRYNYTPNPTIEDQIVPRVKKAGYVTKPDFLTICKWKTQR